MSWRLTLLDRGGRQIEASAQTSLLHSLRAAGEPVLAGCEAGACRTCAARLVSGRVRHPPASLTPELQDAGVILTCVAVPLSDCTLKLGKRGRTLLSAAYLLPWQE